LDYLIDRALIITMDERGRVIREGAIYIEDGVIRAVGKRREVRKRYSTDNVIEAGKLIVLPGLISAHTHVAMSIMRGLASDREDVISRVYWPLEEALDEEIVKAGALLGGAEALLSGLTTVADHYFFMEKVAEAFKELGLRGVLGHTIMDLKGPWKGEAEYRKALKFIEKWKGDSLIKPLLAPHATDTVSLGLLKEIGEVAREKGVRVHMHLSQTLKEVKEARAKGFRSPVALLKEAGLLNKDLIAAHCVYVDDEDLRLIAINGVNVVHCPSTYMLNGEEVRSYELITMGVNVALGLDAPCFNDNLDPFEEMRLFIMSQRQKYRKLVLKSMDAIKVATIGGAKALGIYSEVGSIEEGKKADIVLLKYEKLKFAPYINPIAALVYSACANDVYSVMVNGEIVVWNGKLVKIKEEEIINKVMKSFDKLLSRVDFKYIVRGFKGP